MFLIRATFFACLPTWPLTSNAFWAFVRDMYPVDVLEQRQYKNDSKESRWMLILKLPPFSAHRLAQWKRAAISQQTFIRTPSSRSYIILALGSHYGSWEFPLASGCLWKSNKSIHCVANSLLQVAFKRWHEWGHLQEHSFLLIFWVPFSTWSFVQ